MSPPPPSNIAASASSRPAGKAAGQGGGGCVLLYIEQADRPANAAPRAGTKLRSDVVWRRRMGVEPTRDLCSAPHWF